MRKLLTIAIALLVAFAYDEFVYNSITPLAISKDK
jgi:hypothetical protein